MSGYLNFPLQRENSRYDFLIIKQEHCTFLMRILTFLQVIYVSTHSLSLPAFDFLRRILRHFYQAGNLK